MTEEEIYLTGPVADIREIMDEFRPRPFRVTLNVLRVDELSAAMLMLKYDKLTRVYKAKGQ